MIGSKLLLGAKQRWATNFSRSLNRMSLRLASIFPLQRLRVAAALLPRLFRINFPGHTTSEPPVGFELATNPYYISPLVRGKMFPPMGEPLWRSEFRYSMQGISGWMVCFLDDLGKSRNKIGLLKLHFGEGVNEKWFLWTNIQKGSGRYSIGSGAAVHASTAKHIPRGDVICPAGVDDEEWSAPPRRLVVDFWV